MRDDMALEMAATLLLNTGAFDAVSFASSEAEIPNEGAEAWNAAARLWLDAQRSRPEGRDRVFESNSDGTYTIERVTYFVVRLLVLDEDEKNRLRRLSRLDSIVRKELNDSDLGGLVEGHWTRLDTPHPDDKVTHPTASWLIYGEFRYYLDDGEADRDVSDTEAW